VIGPVRVWYATVYVRDFELALRFYRDKLGLPLRFADEKFGFASFATPGAGFTIARIDPADPEQGKLLSRHTGIAFGVDDLQKTYEAWLADPEGNLLTLDQYRQE
jgi:catechol 2,3-dioxygenase-like lactoylglutathione lyase family enzyme